MARPYAFELLAHGGNIGVGPLPRMHAFIAGGIFRRQPKCIPAHRVKHVEALRALKASDHVAHGVIAHMPHVDAPRRVGEHLEDVAFGKGGLIDGGKDVAPAPDILPARIPILLRCSAPRLSPSLQQTTGPASFRQGGPRGESSPGVESMDCLPAEARGPAQGWRFPSLMPVSELTAASVQPWRYGVCRKTLTFTASARSRRSRI
jgi:hypothetical protein